MQPLQPEAESHLWFCRLQTQQQGLVVGRPTFCNFTLRVRQKRSQKVKNWGGGMPPNPSSRRATRVLIGYWNPPFPNSRSATVETWPWLPFRHMFTFQRSLGMRLVICSRYIILGLGMRLGMFSIPGHHPARLQFKVLKHKDAAAEEGTEKS